MTSVTEMEEESSSPSSEALEKEKEGEGEEEKEEEEEGKEGEGEVRNYAGGRFAGVGDFAPTIQTRVKRRKVALPLFKCKPESAIR